MKLLRIFSIYFEDALQYRSTSFVWFLLALFNPLMVLLFWRGAFASGGTPLEGWTYQTLASYYLLLVIANSLLMSHIETSVARDDIQNGWLSKYLTKPFNYIVHKFFSELPWRIMESFFAAVTLIFFITVLNVHVSVSKDIVVLLMAIGISITAHVIGFLYKMILGLSAFWITDYSGLMELSDVVIVIFSGSVMPLVLFPGILHEVALYSPFAYMIYYPIVAFLGQMSVSELLLVVLGQLVWITIFFVICKRMWSVGVKKFTGLGQ